MVHLILKRGDRSVLIHAESLPAHDLQWLVDNLPADFQVYTRIERSAPVQPAIDAQTAQAG